MIIKELAGKIANKAVYLENFHILDLAWNKEDAIEMIQSILSDNIGIIGGDVYKYIEGILDHNGDLWTCDQLINESDLDFNLRSKHETIRYITKYPVKDDEVIVFAIVFTYDPVHPELSYRELESNDE